MRFVETPIFTKEVRSLLSDDDYRTLQTVLMLRPEQGEIIRGTGGLRKIRWGGKGHGKRGGYRLIYYWDNQTDTFYMLFIYPKNRQEDLTAKQRKLLSKLVQEEFK
ncbi:type II toxin-antitoxin system RelE/ParE family toxin [bacterium]|nr:type II toxin-antitoxin system RelE/ParE family toxin [bacterium]